MIRRRTVTVAAGLVAVAVAGVLSGHALAVGMMSTSLGSDKAAAASAPVPTSSQSTAAAATTSLPRASALPVPASLAVSTAPAASLRRVPTVVTDLAYADDSPSQRLDLRLPAGAGPVPLVVYFHGGGWVAGDKAAADELAVVEPLVAHGFAVASVTYRLAPESVYPSAADDALAALVWLRAHAGSYGVDVARVALFGVSAGAQLAALVGIDAGAETVRAVVDWSGPVDLGSVGPQLRSDLRCGGAFDDPDDPTSFWAAFVGGPVRDRPDVVVAADPRRHIAPDVVLPRFLVAHGERDCVVPVAQSRLLVDALHATGDRSSVLRVLPGVGHARQFPTVTELRVVMAFLDETFAT